MSRRTTAPNSKNDQATFRPLTTRQRSPILYWVAILAVLCMVLTTFAGALFVLF